MKKSVIVLGSTGSVGRQVLEVIEKEKEHFNIVGLTARSNLELLQKQIDLFSPQAVALVDREKAKKLVTAGKRIKIYGGAEGITEIVKSLPADLVFSCIVGKAALIPTLEAIRADKDVALANKESMVIAGDILKKEAKKRNVSLIPVDSEEVAIFQCLKGNSINDIKRIYLTASGGPLYKWKGDFNKITPEQALSHPRWRMGQKISLDSATLANKALEVIETSRFFEVKVEKIRVLIHPQAIVHSLVEFIDGSILSQLGVTDMRLPIHYALNYSYRRGSYLPSLSLTQLEKISFEAPDFQKFPALRLGYQAGEKGGTLPAVFNAADEVAGESFLKGEITFTQIIYFVEEVMKRHKIIYNPSLEEILNADEEARRITCELMKDIK
ncbi:MAG: 1-deoxy-D-xylulose-5-phosphate reductoisomerase [Candidatus Aerophobetes bacterium]|nr:1-deoxy-D-xylulose-5-phosphate reductoisomerase [Candidatus Aerophobetes bacterium]